MTIHLNPVIIDRKHIGARLSCVWMLAAALIRLFYYLPKENSPSVFIIHLCMPVLASVIFLYGILSGGKKAVAASMTAVAVGVVFFVLKAQAFAPLHRNLCLLLYTAVLVLYFLTVLGIIPTVKLLYPLFGLPFLYHVLVEDTKAYFFAEPPVPVVEWMPEISVLCIMASLFCLTFSMKKSPNH